MGDDIFPAETKHGSQAPNGERFNEVKCSFQNAGEYEKRKQVQAHFSLSYNREIMLPISSAVSESGITGHPSMCSFC